MPNTLWLNAPMFYEYWCGTIAALMWTSTNNPLFFCNCTTWLIDVYITWSEENIHEVLHLVHVIPLNLQFRHMQRHVRWHANEYISYPYPSTTFVYNGCLSKLCHDGYDGKEHGSRGPLISVSTRVFGENASWVLNAHSTKVSSLKSWLHLHHHLKFWRWSWIQNPA